MKRITLLLLFFPGILISQSGWVSINSPNNYYSFAKIQFTDNNTGYIYANYPLYHWGFIYKTTNTGDSWNLNFSPDCYLADIYFINNLTGFACGYYQKGYAIIVRTTNGGGTWLTVQSRSDSYSIFNKLAFSSDSIGHAWGFHNSDQSYSFHYQTTNYGTSWDSVPSISHPADVKFINNQTGFITSYASTIFKTTNGGFDWTLKSSGLVNYLNEICFTNNVGYICGSNNALVKSTDYGETWSLLQFNSNVFPRKSISFTNINTGYSLNEEYGGNTSINKTTNGGYNWSVQTIPQTSILNYISFINKDTGFAVGESGTILRTFSGGSPIGIQPISTEIPKSFSLSQNYPNPFNPSTKIRFEVAGSSAAQTFLSVYDILGKEVATLVNESLKPGTYEVEWNASDYPSGVYFYKLVVGGSTSSPQGFSETKRMVLIK